MTVVVTVARCGARRALAFCDRCGSHIFAASAEEPRQLYALRVGTLEQRDRLKPSMQVWCRSQLDWLGDITELNALEKQ